MLLKHFRQLRVPTVPHSEDASHLSIHFTSRQNRQEADRRQCEVLFFYKMSVENLGDNSCRLCCLAARLCGLDKLRVQLRGRQF